MGKKLIGDDTDRLSDWLNRDISQLISPYQRYVDGFHSIPIKKSFLFLNKSFENVPTYLVKNDRLSMPLVNIYDVKAGSKTGLRYGFVFYTTVDTHFSKDFLIVSRRQVEAKQIVLNKQLARRHYYIDNLLFFSIDDDALLITKTANKDSKFIKSLEA